MDWLTYAVLGGAVILLGLAIVFLLFAEIASRAQETSWKARRKAARKKGFSRINHTAFDAESSSAEAPLSKTEVSAQEKTALRITGKETQSENQPAGEDDHTGKEDLRTPRQ